MGLREPSAARQLHTRQLSGVDPLAQFLAQALLKSHKTHRLSPYNVKLIKTRRKLRESNRRNPARVTAAPATHAVGNAIGALLSPLACVKMGRGIPALKTIRLLVESRVASIPANAAGARTYPPDAWGRAGSLMRCDDSHYYVVKFQNNPQ